MSIISSTSRLCSGEFCGGESLPYLASPCSSSSHTPQPQACHTPAMQPSTAPSSLGIKYNFFDLAFDDTHGLIPTYLLALSPTTLLLAPFPLVKLNFSFSVTHCAFLPLCLCSACAHCQVCPSPLGLWKYDSFFTASGKSHLLPEVPLYPELDVILSTSVPS